VLLSVVSRILGSRSYGDPRQSQKVWPKSTILIVSRYYRRTLSCGGTSGLTVSIVPVDSSSTNIASAKWTHAVPIDSATDCGKGRGTQPTPVVCEFFCDLVTSCCLCRNMGTTGAASVTARVIRCLCKRYHSTPIYRRLFIHTRRDHSAPIYRRLFIHTRREGAHRGFSVLQFGPMYDKQD